MLETVSQSPVETLMKAKAGYAHRLLDAVVMADLETARDQAFRLKAVAETADWNVLDTEEYAQATEAFIDATDNLLQAASSRKSEAAALAYVEVTLSCVHCHQYVRAHRQK
jgi:cytochrome c556